MKKFILKISTFSIPILLAIVLVNYIGDSAHLYNTDYEVKMAKIVKQGDYVTNIDNYDERIFQKEIIENQENTPETIILGSSKAMFIDGALIGDSSVFNHAVSSASLEDYIAIYQLYKENNSLPQKVVIDVEPHLFNKNNKLERWKSIQDFYYNFKKETNSNNDIGKYEELISLSYFQSSLPKLFKVITGGAEPESTQSKFNSTNTKLTDGTLVYGKSIREGGKIRRDKKVSLLLAGKMSSIEEFNSIDKGLWKEFESLISDMRKNNITVEFFLCPHHPDVYNRVKEDYEMVIETEDLIVKYARDQNIKLYGSFSPYAFELDETFFYDGLHCNKDGLEKIYL